MSFCCPICTEEVPIVKTGASLLSLGRSCSVCGQMVCQSCLYRHIESILNEGMTGDGRNKMACPTGCGQEISDGEIRRCFKERNNRNVMGRLIGKAVMWCLHVLGWFSPANQDPFRTSRYYTSWSYWLHTSSELNDIRRYERWSLAVALRQLQQQQRPQQEQQNEQQQPQRRRGRGGRGKRDTVSLVVVRCPSPDCEYQWLADAEYRRSKIQHERTQGNSSSSPSSSTSPAKAFVRSLLPAALSPLWYSPPKPQGTPHDWVRPEYVRIIDHNSGDNALGGTGGGGGGGNPLVGLGAPTSTTVEEHADELCEEERSNADGRRMVCAGCHCVFCGLCRRPWRHGMHCHAGKSCDWYERKFPRNRNDGGEDDGFWFVSQSQNTRCCPGCSMRTSRIDGCNHMTCPCGKEWCYVCECTWNNSHYSCRDSDRRRSQDAAGATGCVIS